jgi:hypothetical protein
MTPLGPSVQFIIEESSKQFLIYLPRRYERAVKDEGIKMINRGRVLVNYI